MIGIGAAGRGPRAAAAGCWIEYARSLLEWLRKLINVTCKSSTSTTQTKHPNTRSHLNSNPIYQHPNRHFSLSLHTESPMSSSSLTSILLDTNLTPQKIQRSSRYIINGSVPLESVTAWRRCLSTCSDDQLLPLLYVANETLQTIARKKLRTKEFLEAFASVLNSSIKEICSRIVASRSLKNDLIEKVRRTIKIWGDRQVYSQRFVGEVLAVCEPFRKGGVNRRSSISSSNGGGDDDDDDDDDALVPVAAVVNENENENDSVTSAIFGDPSQKLLNVDVDMNISRSKKKGKKRPSSNDEEDDDDVFGSIDDDILSPNKGSSSFG